MIQSEYHSEIIRYYNRSQKDYELVWGLKKHRSFHYGYWTKQTKNHEQAVNNMTEQVAIASGLKEGMMVADLGCGIGGPACFLAKKYKCHVFGISLAEKQIAQAKELAKSNNLQRSVYFTEGDFCNTPFDDDSFDVVYAIESSCYAANKITFLQEAYRILKPGGKIVILDFFWTGNERTKEDTEIMTLWCDSWAIDNYAYSKDFFLDCKNAGFRQVAKTDFTPNVLPSIKKLHFWFYPSLVGDTLLRLIGKRKGRHKNLYSALYQYQAYERGLWQYMMFTGSK